MAANTFPGVNKEEMEALIQIKSAYLKGELSAEQAKNKIKERYTKISALEFAYTEQRLKDMGFTDEKVHENMDELIGLLDEILEKNTLNLPNGHPIRTYIEENTAIKKLLLEMDAEAEKPYSQEKWTEMTEKVYQFNNHLSRKQNQLFSKLEEKGFDRPSKIMWTFDNEVKQAIRKLVDAVKDGKSREEVITQYQVMNEAILDLMEKEELVLYPTSIKLISPEEFAVMRIGDDEIGYCLIENPAPFKVESAKPASAKPESLKSEGSQPAESPNSDFMKDMMALAAKYQIGGAAKENEVLDVKQGKLTLEQINLIYQHMPMDFSFVDENDLVKFYTDTTHRIFPRSAGVIGRNVMNCHPRESLGTVQEIIEAFRSGRQDKAEFWIEMGDKFIYILYIAVRDKEGKFRGVLEMMQDVAHIRSLTGQRRLLNWDSADKPVNPDADSSNSSEQASAVDSSEIKKAEPSQSGSAESQAGSEGIDNPYGLTGDSVIYDIIQKYPYIREFMPTISPKYEKILNPVAFNTIGRIATLEMVAQRGGFELSEIIRRISEKIAKEENA